MPLQDAYLVREHFKAGGLFYAAGTVLSKEKAARIPLLKIRLNERKLIRLDIEQSHLINLCEWIKVRYNVDAKANLRKYVAEAGAETPDTPVVPDPPEDVIIPDGEEDGKENEESAVPPESTPPPGTPPNPTKGTK